MKIKRNDHSKSEKEKIKGILNECHQNELLEWWDLGI
jgi:hypothetical protein